MQLEEFREIEYFSWKNLERLGVHLEEFRESEYAVRRI
jgi:hypothetical protein